MEARLFGRLLACEASAIGEALALPEDEYLAAADRHGVVPLLAESARFCPGRSAPHQDAVERLARQHAALDLVHERATVQVLTALDDAGVRALLIKGVDLAYSLYDRSDLRPRLDVDIWVPPAERLLAAPVLQRLGYRALPGPGERVMSQETFVAASPGGPHVIDLHWRVANAERFGDALAFDEAWTAAEARPRLTAVARGLGRQHALALACVHRAAHHYGSRRLIWLKDIELLARSLSAEEWEGWARLVLERRVARVSAAGLECAAEFFGATVPPQVMDALSRNDEPDARSYLDPEARHASRILADLRQASSWRARRVLISGHVFPASTYMRGVYAPGSRWPLPLLYALRLVKGAGRWLRRG